MPPKDRSFPSVGLRFLRYPGTGGGGGGSDEGIPSIGCCCCGCMGTGITGSGGGGPTSDSPVLIFPFLSFSLLFSFYRYFIILKLCVFFN